MPRGRQSAALAEGSCALLEIEKRENRKQEKSRSFRQSFLFRRGGKLADARRGLAVRLPVGSFASASSRVRSHIASMSLIPASGGHRLRKDLFKKAIQQGWLEVDEVEASLPPGLLSSAERWLLYFSLRASEVELRDAQGRVVTPDEVVPDGRAPDGPSRRDH